MDRDTHETYFQNFNLLKLSQPETHKKENHFSLATTAGFDPRVCRLGNRRSTQNALRADEDHYISTEHTHLAHLSALVLERARVFSKV